LTSSDRWECVHFYRSIDLPSIEVLADSGYHVASISGVSLASSEALVRAVAEAFEFPAYFGGSWDALVDCLEDLEWLPGATGYVLVIDDVGACGLTEPLTRLIAIWLAVAQLWATDAKPFHLVGLLRDDA